MVRPGADGVVAHQTELTHCLGLEFSEGSSEPFGHDRVEKRIDDWIEVVKSPWKILGQLIMKLKFCGWEVNKTINAMFVSKGI